MSNAGSAKVRGSVPADSANRCSVVPRRISSPSNSKSSNASRVTQVIVGLTRITSSTAARPRSGRRASSRHWSGWSRKVRTARLSWLRVVSKPPNTSSTMASRSSCSDKRSPSASCTCTSRLVKSSVGRRRRASSAASQYSNSLASAVSIRGRSWPRVTPIARPTVAESWAIAGHSCSGKPSRVATTRAA